MNHIASVELVARGSSSGQPVGCVDASALSHASDTMAGVRAAFADTLEAVRREYFGPLGGDPGSIVAVLTRPPSPGADHGLLFVAADGPIGGCGEATMFACAAVGRESVVFDTTSGPIPATGRGGGVVELEMPPVAQRSRSFVVAAGGTALAVRTLSVAGNPFAVVAAADAGIPVDGPPHEVARRGDALLRSIAASAGTRPGLLLLTEPVAGGTTRSAVVWGNKILNRGPCGTGTCARLLIALEDGDLAPGQALRHYSPFGSAFEARLDGAAIRLTGRVSISRPSRAT